MAANQAWRHSKLEAAVTDEQEVWVGTFWSPTEGVHSPAKLRRGKRFTLIPESDIVSSLCRVTTHEDGVTTVRVFADPEKVVADFQPRILHGELSDGVRLTLLDAQLSDVGMGQSFDVHKLVWGEHLGPDPLFSSVRFEPPWSLRWSGLKGTAQCDGPNPTGQLTGYVEEERRWVEFVSTVPMSLLALESVVWHSADAFMSIWCNAAVKPVRIQVRTNEQSEWLSIVTVGLMQQPESSALDSPLLPFADMSLAALAKWLVMAAGLSPIPFLVSPGTSDQIPLQAQVLSVASALEGLHRRIGLDQNYFKTLSKSQQAKVSGAAKQAALSELKALDWKDLEGARDRVEQSLGHLGQTTLAERLKALAGPAADVAPGLLGPSLDAWAKEMKNTRNGEGHQLYAAPEFGADKFDPYYQLLTSGQWVARISLLLIMDVDAATLTAALRSHEPFLFDLANMDTCTNGWAGSLETFRRFARGKNVEPPKDPKIVRH